MGSWSGASVPSVDPSNHINTQLDWGLCPAKLGITITIGIVIFGFTFGMMFRWVVCVKVTFT